MLFSTLTSESSSRVDEEQASTKFIALADQRSKAVEVRVSLFCLINCNISVPKEFASAEVGSLSPSRIVGSDVYDQFIILCSGTLLTNFDIPTLREPNVSY